MKKITAIFLLSFGLLSASGAFADEVTELHAKLDKIMETQQQILGELATVKSELDTIRVRVSVNG